MTMCRLVAHVRLLVAAGRWTRKCPVCGRLLGKDQPLDRIACECGWTWE
jgi:hypothetical protein